MKQRVKDKIKELGLVMNRPNRRQGRTHNLCTCRGTKKDHYKNRLGHVFKAGSEKNVVFQPEK